MKKIFLVLVSLFTLVACKSTAVYNVEASQVPANLSVVQVEKSIVLALLDKGWKISSNKGGVIDADISVRKHTASIKIKFDNSQYSISYVNSTNLKYNSQKNTIHRNYNNWIINIDRLVQRNLTNELYTK